MNANVVFRFKLTFYMSTSDLVAMYGCNEPFITFSSISTKLTHAKKHLIPFHLAQQGRRNVFTTGPAKFDSKDYAIKCMGGR